MIMGYINLLFDTKIKTFAFFNSRLKNADAFFSEKDIYDRYLSKMDGCSQKIINFLQNKIYHI